MLDVDDLRLLWWQWRRWWWGCGTELIRNDGIIMRVKKSAIVFIHWNIFLSFPLLLISKRGWWCWFEQLQIPPASLLILSQLTLYTRIQKKNISQVFLSKLCSSCVWTCFTFFVYIPWTRTIARRREEKMWCDVVKSQLELWRVHDPYSICHGFL